METKVQVIKVSYLGNFAYWHTFVKNILREYPDGHLLEIYTKHGNLTETVYVNYGNPPNGNIVYHNPYGPAILQPNHPDPLQRTEFWLHDNEFSFEEYIIELEYQNLSTPKEIALLKMKYS